MLPPRVRAAVVPLDLRPPRTAAPQVNGLPLRRFHRTDVCRTLSFVRRKPWLSAHHPNANVSRLGYQSNRRLFSNEQPRSTGRRSLTSSSPVHNEPPSRRYASEKYLCSAPETARRSSN